MEQNSEEIKKIIKEEIEKEFKKLNSGKNVGEDSDMFQPGGIRMWRSFEQMNPDIEYTADSDLLVVVNIEVDNVTEKLRRVVAKGILDGNWIASATSNDGVGGVPTFFNSFTMPVLKGKTWKIEVGDPLKKELVSVNVFRIN